MSPSNARPAPPNNLPSFLTTFVGREREIAEVKQQINAARLLTLTGPGGCGKTRLALQTAAELLPEFDDGAWWCDLAAVTDPAHVAQMMAAALHLAETAEHSPLDGLISALRERHALLVLDNCEHLLAGCAAMCLVVLRACPSVRILATSLQPLGLPQERAWPVPPLGLPAARDTDTTPRLQADAVRFFVDRARRALPSFSLTPENLPAVISICRQLDGLPLALELAAARARLLTVQQIAERLDDVFGLLTRGSLSSLPRHQTLRLAIDWSCQFLTGDELLLLRRLGVFAGPFTLSMAEAVCGAGLSPASVLNLLDGLADKSFLALLPRSETDEARYRLLEMIRQYARELLEGSGEGASIRDRYLDWCVAWAEPASRRLTGPGRGAWLAEFESRQEHFRAALRWACTSHQPESGLRLAAGLGRYWMSNGLTEGRAWLEELLALIALGPAQAAPVPETFLARALLYSGRLAVRQGDDAHGLRRGEQSLALFRRAADQSGCLSALNLLALAAQDTSDYERAAACYAEALALSRQAADDRMTAVLLVNQGLMFYEQQDYRRAEPIWEEAYALIHLLADYSIASLDNLACLAMMRGDLARARTLLEQELQRYGDAGDAFETALLMMDLGETARRKGEFERAQSLLRQALERQQQLGDTSRIGETLANLGSLARNQGEIQSARESYELGLAYLEKSGYTRLISQVKLGLGLLEAAQGRDQEALAFFREALRTSQKGRHLVCRLEAVEEMAGLLARRGDAQRAARWLAATQAARADLGAPVPPVERERFEHSVRLLRAGLGDEAYAALEAAGRQLSLEQVAAEAMGATEGTPPPPLATSPLSPGLQVLALGPTRVVIGQRLVAPTDWTYARSKELLFYLLTRGSAGKAQIGLDLWPEASPDQLRAAFHGVLHHLRRALGQHDAILFAGGEYSFNRDLALEYDVATFEDHLRQARLEAGSAAQPAGRARAISRLEAAAALWRGDFLADVEAGEWALYQREALRQSFLDSLLLLGELHFAEARYAAAAAAFQRALGLDGYLELAHRGLMRCYARQGEAGRAARHYQDLRDLLQSELSTAPSPETTLLYDRIRRGDDI